MFWGLLTLLCFYSYQLQPLTQILTPLAQQIRLIKANRSLYTDLSPDTVVIMSFIRNMIDNQNEWLAQTKLSRRPIVFTPLKTAWHHTAQDWIVFSFLWLSLPRLGTLSLLWANGKFHVISHNDCKTTRCWKSLLSRKALIGTIAINNHNNLPIHLIYQ